MNQIKCCLFSVLFLLVFMSSVRAQWVDEGDDGVGSIYYSNGNIGVGTSIPSANFHVSDGSLNLAWAPIVGTVAIFEGGKYERAFLSMVSKSTSQSEIWFGDEHRQNSGRIRYEHSKDAFSFYTNDVADRMVIDRDGHIGIGTGSPSAQLHVQQGSVNHVWTPIEGTVGIFEGQSAGRAFVTILGKSTGQSEIWFGDEDRQNSGRVRYEHDNDALVFSTNGVTDRMRIDGNGNVGIGTANPGSFKLAVEGKIGAREIQVKTGAWADYVFEDDYTLADLSEVEKYIKENRHLPGIPTALEVEKDGVNLGEMNVKLLEKVEELTLYVIELEKRIKSLEKNR